MAGAWLTVSVKFCDPENADAVGGGEVEGVAACGAGAGVPLMVAVPLPLLVKVTPAGRRTEAEVIDVTSGIRWLSR